MAVTELAILHLKPSVSLTDQSFRAKLLRSRNVMENALGVSGRRFVYYQDVEDPTVLYLLGDWNSPSEHWDLFIPSPENQELLELLKDEFDIPRIIMYHVNVPNARIPGDAEVISIGWYRIRTADKAKFEEQLPAHVQGADENSDRETKTTGGWRIEKLDDWQDEEEWVSFCGWDKAQEHNGSDQTEPWKKDGQFHKINLGSEVRQGIRIDLG